MCDSSNDVDEIRHAGTSGHALGDDRQTDCLTELGGGQTHSHARNDLRTSLMSSHPTCSQEHNMRVRSARCAALLCCAPWRAWETPELTSAADVPVGSRLSMSSSPGLTTRGADRMLCLASSYPGGKQKDSRGDREAVCTRTALQAHTSLIDEIGTCTSMAAALKYAPCKDMHCRSSARSAFNQACCRLLFPLLYCNRIEAHTLRASPTHWLCSRDATSSCCSLARDRMGVSLSRVLSCSMLLLCS